MPPPRRTDNNHREIVQALRQVGAYVMDVHGLPGCLDVIAVRAGRAYFLEIKDGNKPASARRLTPAEELTVQSLASRGVTAHIVIDVESALRAIGAIL